MRTSTTVKDIAAVAGVSKAAVSKVLHDSSSSVRVSAERALKIKEIATRMGYVPNAAARNLSGRQSQTIGIYFEDLAGIAGGPLYTMHLIDGVSKVLFRNHYRLSILAELDPLNTRHALGDGRLDGVVWCRVVRDQSTWDLLKDSPIPVVSLSDVRGESDSPNLFSICCDNAGGVDEAVGYLWRLGHTKILFIHEEQESDASDCVDRKSAFCRSMEARGVSVGDDDVLTWDWNLEAFTAWWQSKPPHTAVFCWSERCAGRLLERCRQLKVRVPSELSVIGFDSTQYCEQTRPRLTAVRQPIAEMGGLAAETILNCLEGNPPSNHSFILPCSLDIRGSTARPALLGQKP